MKKLYPLLIVIGSFSCSTPKHPDATSLCNCWSRLRFERNDSISNRIADSCDNLYITVIKKKKGHEEWTELFDAAYNECRQ